MVHHHYDKCNKVAFIIMAEIPDRQSSAEKKKFQLYALHKKTATLFRVAVDR